MKKMVVILLVLISSVVLFPSSTMAANGFVASSLEEQNIVLSGSDIELIAVGQGMLYAVVQEQGGYHHLFRSQTNGRSWQRASAQGLPEMEKFISLKTIFDHPETIILTTVSSVFLSRNGGMRFESLGGPSGLSQRGEEISSLAIVNGDSPLILVGAWNPTQGKFAEDGVYLWGSKGSQWEPQGMRATWQGKGYFSDVTSVAFGPWGTILAVATGDPDGSGSLPEATYLNIGYPGQGGLLGAGWNPSPFSAWPIRIAAITETEILSSKIACSEFDQESRIYVLFNTRQRVKDDVYLIRLVENYAPITEARKLELPKPAVSLDSLDYRGNPGNLIVGVTTTRGIQVYSLKVQDERSSPPYWESSRGIVTDTGNCQAVIAADGTVFVATSGQGSYFARSEQGILVPISFIDVSGGIYQVLFSQSFLKDKTLFLNYGGKSIFKVKLDVDYKLFEAQRFFYVPQSSAALRIISSDQTLFAFEVGTKRFWFNKNDGGIWLERVGDVEMIAPEVVANKVWCAGKDGMLYQLTEDGSIQKRISSGFTWIQKIAPGPEGMVLVSGGSREGSVESLSLINGDSYQLLPVFPAVFSSDVKIVNSQKENAVYCLASNSLYRLVIGGTSWEKISDFNWGAADFFVDPLGLYIFSCPQIYFSSFPLGKDSKWKALVDVPNGWTGGKLVTVDEKSLFFLWDSSKITVYNPKIPEEKVVSPIVSPTSTPTPIPTPTPTPTPVITPTPTPTPVPTTVKPTPPAQTQTVQPKPTPTPTSSAKPQTPAKPSGWLQALKVLGIILLTALEIVFLVVMYKVVRKIWKRLN